MSADGALVRWLRGGTAGGGGAEAISRATAMPEKPTIDLEALRAALTHPDRGLHGHELAEHTDDLLKLMRALSEKSGTLGNGDVGAYELALDAGERQWSLRDDRLCAPHWKYFVAMLGAGEDHEYWAFRHLPFLPTKILVPALSRRSICLLEVANMGGPDTFRFVCELLEHGSIRRLILEDVDLFDGSDKCSRLCRAVEWNRSLEELTLGKMNVGSDSGIHDEGNPLRSVLHASRNLKYLNLCNSHLGRDGGKLVSLFIEGNPCLTHLVLGFPENDSDGLDVFIIAGALSSNTNLRSLDFFGSFARKFDITSEFAAALCKALFATEVSHLPLRLNGLNAVARSNHTCFVHLTTCGSNADTALLEVLNCNESPADNKRWKILSVLYATNCKGICNEMERVPVAVIPDVLALISAGMDEGQLPDVAHDGVSGAVIANIDAWGDATPNKTVELEGLDEVSIGGDSIYSKDSILDDLDSAFDEVDEVYDDFHRSFTGCGYACPKGCESTGRRARLTMAYQMLKHHGLALMDRQQSHLSKAPKKGRGRRKRKRG